MFYIFNPKRIISPNPYVVAIIFQAKFFSGEPLWLIHAYGQSMHSMKGHPFPTYCIHTFLFSLLGLSVFPLFQRMGPTRVISNFA